MPKTRTADVVVCGAGIAGVAVAYQLAVRRGMRRVVLVDEREPLTLTSAKGTGGYRNWWPGPDGAMVRFMNRSIALMEELALESDDAFRMRRSGYAFLTAEEDGLARMRREAALVSALGAGAIREVSSGLGDVPIRGGSSGLGGAPIRRGSPDSGPIDRLSDPARERDASGDADADGADLVLDRERIRALVPCVTPDAIALLHVRRAGTFDPRAFGAWLLGRLAHAGVLVVRDRLDGVETAGGRISAARLHSGERIETGALVVAPGPHLARVGALLGFEMPVILELHGKIVFDDTDGIVPAQAPLLIWNDPVKLEWSDEERAHHAASAERRLLEPFPGGVHVRPSGIAGDHALQIIWTYDTTPREMIWPPEHDPHYAEILIRGLARMIPAFSAYFGQGARARVDGGYYCKAPDNRPILGPLPLEGAYVAGALSGFGVMASQAAAELVVAHLLSEPLPDYAPAFRYGRHADPEYQRFTRGWDAKSGQL
jgi:glycine/D-amino acid oxidase-like deaminating enzyme